MSIYRYIVWHTKGMRNNSTFCKCTNVSVLRTTLNEQIAKHFLNTLTLWHVNVFLRRSWHKLMSNMAIRVHFMYKKIVVQDYLRAFQLKIAEKGYTKFSKLSSKKFYWNFNHSCAEERLLLCFLTANCLKRLFEIKFENKFIEVLIFKRCKIANIG